MKLSQLKQAAEDILVRPPDLDEKKAPATKEPDGGTAPVKKPKEEVQSDTPEDAVTEKGASEDWAKLADAEKAYFLSFIETCKEAGVDPTTFMAPELVKAAQAVMPDASKNPIGFGAISAVQRASQTPAQAAAIQNQQNQAWGNRGFFSRLGQRIVHPIQSSRASKAWANAPAQIMQGQMMGLPGAAQNIKQPAAAAYKAAFVQTCKEAGIPQEEAEKLLQ